VDGHRTAQEASPSGAEVSCTYKVQPEMVGNLYRDWVMPLTKKVQVAYLLRRLDG
jgi:chorismate mutase